MFPGLDLPYKVNPAKPLTAAGDELDHLSVDRPDISCSICLRCALLLSKVLELGQCFFVFFVGGIGAGFTPWPLPGESSSKEPRTGSSRSTIRTTSS